MKLILCAITIGIAAAIIWYLWSGRKPNILRNEANGPANVRDFKGYKESLKTPINQGTPFYGETLTGWTTSAFRSGNRQGA